RPLKFHLLRSIARATRITEGSQRGIEFLWRQAQQRDDLAVASEAINALAASRNPLAGEFLRTLFNKGDDPLRRDLVNALAEMPYFPCEENLIELLNDDHTPKSLLQSALIAISRRAYRPARLA